MSSTIEVESFAARLEKLERQNRWLRIGLLGVLVIAATTLVMGSQAETKPGKIKATSIGLYDLDGKLRGTISDKGLAFFDEKGMRLSLGVVPEDGPGLTLLDEKGKRRVELLLSKEGPVLTFSDAAEKQRLTLAATGDLSSVVLSDEANRPGMTGALGLPFLFSLQGPNPPLVNGFWALFGFFVGGFMGTFVGALTGACLGSLGAIRFGARNADTAPSHH